MSHDERRAAGQELFSNLPGISFLEEATIASEALRRLEECHVDVVLVFSGLPDVNAIELTRRIRESHPDVRIVISTASNTPADIFSAMDTGADAYVLKGNYKGLEMAIRSVRLGTVWLDPGIATQVLEVVVASSMQSTRLLPTGLMVLPLMPDERQLLNEVAASNCVDGVCLVDPSFVRKLRRFAPG